MNILLCCQVYMFFCVLDMDICIRMYLRKESRKTKERHVHTYMYTLPRRVYTMLVYVQWYTYECEENNRRERGMYMHIHSWTSHRHTEETCTYVWVCKKKKVATQRDDVQICIIYMCIYIYTYVYIYICIYIFARHLDICSSSRTNTPCPDRPICGGTCMTVSTKIATPPKSTKSRNSDSLVSCGTKSKWDFGLI